MRTLSLLIFGLSCATLTAQLTSPLTSSRGAFMSAGRGSSVGAVSGPSIGSPTGGVAIGVPGVSVTPMPSWLGGGSPIGPGKVEIRNLRTGETVRTMNARDGYGDPIDGGGSYGMAVAAIDVTGDGLQEIVVGAPYAGPNAGHVFVENVAGSYFREVTGSSGHRLGFAFADLGDLDGQPGSEVAIGAIGWGPSIFATPQGRVAIYSFAGLFPTLLATIDGAVPGELVGAALASGDVNGDGVVDLVVGATGDGDPASLAGSVTVHFGPFSAPSYAAAVTVSRSGVAVGERFGWSLAVSDLDGDGMDEVIVGVPQAAGGGRVDVHSGAAIAGGSFGPPVASFTGTAAGEAFGHAVAAVGDYDGDLAADDVGVGAPGAGTVRVYSTSDQTLIDAPTGDANFGYSVAALDVDGDARPELGIGAPSGRGLAAVFGLTQAIHVDGDCTQHASPGLGTAAQPYADLQYAIQQPTTRSGDTLFVANGTYVGDVDLLGKNLRIVGEDRYRTIIVGAVRFSGSNDEVSELREVTVLDGPVRCDTASPVITNCILARSPIEIGDGYASPFDVRPTRPRFVECHLVDSSADYAIDVVGSLETDTSEVTVRPTFTRCSITGNVSALAVVRSYLAVTTFEECVFSSNAAPVTFTYDFEHFGSPPGPPGLQIGYIFQTGFPVGASIPATGPAPAPFPGSGDDLLFEVGVAPAAVTAHASQCHHAPPGSALVLRLSSPGGALDQAPILVGGSLFAVGSLPAPAPLLGVIHIDPFSWFELVGSGTTPFGAPLVVPGGSTFAFLVPPGLTGGRCLLQGFAITPLATNGFLAASNGRILSFE